MWPLADDATLKKKFDDIFAATNYTKVGHTRPLLSPPRITCQTFSCSIAALPPLPPHPNCDRA